MLPGTTGSFGIPVFPADPLSRVVNLCLGFLKSSEFIVGIDEGLSEAREDHREIAE